MRSKLYADPIMLPLTSDGDIYVLQDEKGQTIGTGTRDVCAVLLHIISNHSDRPVEMRERVRETASRVERRPNVRSAIVL